MRYSELFVRTLRLAPREAESPGLQLLLRGGFVTSRSGQGVNVVLLPMGVLVQQRLSRLVEDSLQTLGAQPLRLGHRRVSAGPFEGQPPLATAAGSDPSRFWGRPFGAAAAQVIQSYRQLPVCLYALGTEDGTPVVSPAAWVDTLPALALTGCYLAADQVSITDGQETVSAAFQAVCELSGVDVVWAPAGRNASGEVDLQRLVAVGLRGDRPMVRCVGCGSVEDAASARIRKPARPLEPPRPMREVATPGCKTILDLCQFLGLEPSQTAKAIFLIDQTLDGQQQFIIAVVRGDTDFNPDKLARRLGAACLRPATESEIRQAGAEPGYGSPVGLRGVTVVADDLVAETANLVAGANTEGFHLLDVNYGRDLQADIVADIVLARPDDTCPACGQPLEIVPSVELGWIGGPWTDQDPGEEVWYSDAAGQNQKALTIAFGFFAHRLLGAVAEANFDERGFTWPAEAAPFDIYLMTIGQPESRTAIEADRLYSQLTDSGLSVLYDDRNERAGVKFNDADLFGIPTRVVVGERGLRDNAVEVKGRLEAEAQQVPLDRVLLHLGIAPGSEAGPSAGG